MTEYELTVLIHPDLELDIDKPLAQITKNIEEAGGKIVKQDSWGKKKLAYEIDKQGFANYVYFELELPTDAPLKLSNLFNINKEILRYLLVKADPRVQAQRAEQDKNREEKDDK